MEFTPTINDLSNVELSRLRQLVREEIARLKKVDVEECRADRKLWEATLEKLYKD